MNLKTEIERHITDHGGCVSDFRGQSAFCFVDGMPAWYLSYTGGKLHTEGDEVETFHSQKEAERVFLDGIKASIGEIPGTLVWRVTPTTSGEKGFFYSRARYVFVLGNVETVSETPPEEDNE